MVRRAAIATVLAALVAAGCPKSKPAAPGEGSAGTAAAAGPKPIRIATKDPMSP